MEKTMRRYKQQLDPATCDAVLARGTSGVLALAPVNAEDFPYAVPLSYAYVPACDSAPGRIVFHCAPEGHKLDLIAHDGRASFCVIDKDQVVEREYTTYYRSVIAFGHVRVLGEDEKRRALEVLAEKYAPDDEAGRASEIDKLIGRTCMLELVCEHITGKQAKELIR